MLAGEQFSYDFPQIKKIKGTIEIFYWSSTWSQSAAATNESIRKGGFSWWNTMSLQGELLLLSVEWRNLLKNLLL